MRREVECRWKESRLRGGAPCEDRGRDGGWGGQDDRAEQRLGRTRIGAVRPRARLEGDDDVRTHTVEVCYAAIGQGSKKGGDGGG